MPRNLGQDDNTRQPALQCGLSGDFLREEFPLLQSVVDFIDTSEQVRIIPDLFLYSLCGVKSVPVIFRVFYCRHLMCK